MAIKELPQVVIEASKSWREQKGMVLGPAGIGKSEMLVQGERTLVVDMEGNIKHLACKKIAATSWSDLRDIYALLVQAKQKGPLPYDCIVFDTIDRLIALGEEEVISLARARFDGAIKKGLQINTIGDIPEGVGWDGRKSLIMTMLEKFHQLGIGVWLIGHTMSKEVKTPTSKVDKTTINVGGQLGSLLLGWPNHILTMEANWVGSKLVRKVYTVPSESREAKSHGGLIPDGWALVSVETGASQEERLKVARDNYSKLRSFFTE